MIAARRPFARLRRRWAAVRYGWACLGANLGWWDTEADPPR